MRPPHFRQRAEADVYRACRDHLPDDIVVFFDMHILHRGKRVHEGEADFVVLDPGRGILVLEVKGGGIGYDPATRTWTFRNRHRVVETIDDPFRQASTNKHVLLDMLRGHPRGLRHRVVAGHAVLFPDLTRRDLAALHLPHTPPEIVGSGDDLATFGTVVRGGDARRRHHSYDGSRGPRARTGRRRRIRGGSHARRCSRGCVRRGGRPSR